MTSAAQPVGYMERTRLYYRALGYKQDYVWAQHDEVPFARLGKPLAAARIALVTTASAEDRANKDERGIKHVWSGPTATPPATLFTMDLSWDKESTHTNDRESFLPVETVKALAAEGLVGGLTASFHGVPTEYSHRKTNRMDAPALLARLQAEGADAALLAAL